MTAANEALMDSLVGYYPIDRIGNKTLLDHSLYGHHLRNKGPASLHAQGGISFASLNDPLEDAPTVYSIFRKPQDFSIAFDLYLTATGNVLSVDGPLSASRMWRINATSSTNLDIYLSYDGSTIGSSVSATAGSSILNRWVRVYIAYDGNNIAIVNDGVLGVGNSSSAGDLNVPASSRRLYFGGYYQAASGGASGAIKNLMVWDRYLTGDQRTYVTTTNPSWTPGKLSAGTIPVYLFGGQSNASGESADLDNGMPADLSEFTWNRRDVWTYASQVDQDQIFSANLARRNNSGDGVGIEYGMAVAAPSGSIIIGHAESGSNLHTDWDASSGTEYSTWKTTVTNGLNDLISLGYTPEVKGIVWDQGTGDTDTESNANAYEANLKALIADMRSHVGNEQCVFLIVKLDDEAFGSYPYLETVRTAQDTVAADTTLCTIINQDNYSKVDHVHRDWGSQLRCGYDAMKSVIATVASISSEESSGYATVQDALDTLTESQKVQFMRTGKIPS